MKHTKLIAAVLISLSVLLTLIVIINSFPLQIKLFIERFSGFSVIYGFLAASYVYYTKTTKALRASALICFSSYIINYLLYLSKDLGAIYPQAMAIAFSINTVLLTTVAIVTVLQINKK